jgi:hypothetical protein
MYNLFKFVSTSSDDKVSICITAVDMMLMEAVVSCFEMLVYPRTSLRRMRKTIYNLSVAGHRAEIRTWGFSNTRQTFDIFEC